MFWSGGREGWWSSMDEPRASEAVSWKHIDTITAEFGRATGNRHESPPHRRGRQRGFHPASPARSLGHSKSDMTGYHISPARVAYPNGLTTRQALHPHGRHRKSMRCFLTLVDPQKDMIISGDFNIYPATRIPSSSSIRMCWRRRRDMPIEALGRGTSGLRTPIRAQSRCRRPFCLCERKGPASFSVPAAYDSSMAPEIRLGV